jgi:hypothetical protein
MLQRGNLSARLAFLSRGEAICQPMGLSFLIKNETYWPIYEPRHQKKPYFAQDSLNHPPLHNLFIPL